MGRRTSRGPLSQQNNRQKANRYIPFRTHLWDGSYNPYGNWYAYAPDRYARTVESGIHNQGIRHGRLTARNNSRTSSNLPTQVGKFIQQVRKTPSVSTRKLGFKESLRKYNRSSGRKVSVQLGRALYCNTKR